MFLNCLIAGPTHTLAITKCHDINAGILHLCMYVCVFVCIVYPDLVEEDDDVIDTSTGVGVARKRQRDDDMWTPDGMECVVSVNLYACVFVWIRVCVYVCVLV